MKNIHHKKCLTSFLGGCLVAICFIACSNDNDSLMAAGPIFTIQSNNIAVVSGERFQIALDVGGIAGVTWKLLDIGNASMVDYLGIADTEAEAIPYPDALGTVYYQFQALAMGADEITFASSRSEVATFFVEVR